VFVKNSGGIDVRKQLIRNILPTMVENKTVQLPRRRGLRDLIAELRSIDAAIQSIQHVRDDEPAAAASLVD